ncbi:MAG: hypothetical protein K9N35_06690 [Candidatus Marinimicrobia bacterium]|nr:hypothetical protein [Candidatus Neomarinimicrobiota bacterium]
MSEHIRRHRKKSKRHELSLIREFRIEIIIGVLFLLGVFLLVEELDIKIFVYHAFANSFRTIGRLSQDILEKLFYLFGEFEGSDIVGIILITIACLVFLDRLRQKAIARYGDLTVCPDCGENLHMIHRTPVQRILSYIFRLKIRRYQCKACEFEGLRIRSLHSR